ncbi:cyclophilin-type peptidyl-prolyl cis-trans isomerase [Chloropicon primus]|uniref:Peptidyl-prolyl cis-trans isomerase n=1 Tax=Chloropicon primus TaxID=1764295 RepID=A0A5B8MII6_9CHLO|nr:cyclophilin-type peptidyl-prolyl cis-trans isomerase [Chloropicon primus]UPQ99472.1 cyclophilin-type peptidyl-prolyl cis-trans isomerase [Chloropicon primus]|eukprot:QDZ20263.1 cyclophilin-type peptidyl-prolyl cis-trans isomerase [Chloropicon primus]
MTVVDSHLRLVGKVNDPQYQRVRKAVEVLEKVAGNIDIQLINLLPTDYEIYVQNLECPERGPVKRFHKENMLYMTGETESDMVYAGGSTKFLQWAKDVYGYDDSRTNTMFFKRLATKQFRHAMEKTGHKFFKMEFECGEESLGFVIVELFTSLCPVTCNKFLQYVRGDLGKRYQGSTIHRIVPGGWVQGGDLLEGKGDGIIEEDCFPDETFTVKHSRPGIIGLASVGPHTNNSQFYITLEALPWLDGTKVAFGQVVEGMRVLKVLEKLETVNERPKEQVTIKSCSEIKTA